MYNCDQCTELFWDQLYGLLDEEQGRDLRLHVSACPGCQAALDRCTAQQQLVARAARMYGALAPFVPPPDELSDKRPTPDEPASVPPTLPISSRPRKMRRWPILAAAASVLLTIGGFAWYQQTLAQLQEDRRQTRAAVDTAVERSDTQSRDVVKRLAALPAKVGSEAVHLNVLGSATIQDGIPNRYQGTARDLNGTPVQAPVTARLVALSTRSGARRQVLSEQKVAGNGDFAFSLPSHVVIPADSVAFLEVEARGRRSLARLADKLTVAAPAFRTQVAIDKAKYRPGEVLYFRSLTLNPFTNKPPAKPLSLTTTLTDSRGVSRAVIHSRTRNDGVAAGGFALTDDIAEGECTLKTVEANGIAPPIVCTFHLARGVLPQTDKDLVFDRSGYRPGDDVNASFRAKRLENGAAAANQSVTAKVMVDGAKAAAPAAASRTNSRGEANLKLKLPPSIPGGKADLEIRVNDGKDTKTMIRAIPIVVPEKPRALAPVQGEIELFPEGGRLVDGLTSRVYFRARSHLGAPVDLEGAVVNSQGKEVARLRTRKQRGLGFFDFPASRAEKYGLKLVSPANTIFKTVFPEVQKTGVVMAVKGGVSNDGEPLPVVVSSNRRTDVPLIAVATSRGRVVDQQVAPASKPIAQIGLVPPAGISGVLKITVYESRPEGLVAVAERLVYRFPARRLEVAVKADKDAFSPGGRVSLMIRTHTEAHEPVSGVVLASVVDVAALKPAHAGEDAGPDFYLASELRQAQDLEHMDIWARAEPRAREALDLFLATQGWRRFTSGRPHTGAGPALLVKKTAAGRGRMAGGQSFALLSLDNGSQVKEEYHKELKEARAQVVRVARDEAEELAQQKERLKAKVERAEDALSAFRDLPRRALGVGLATLMAILLAGGCIALLIAVVRTLRRSGATTPYFAVSFASLLLCLVAVLAGRLQGPHIGDRQHGPDPRASANDSHKGFEAFADALSTKRPAIDEALPRGYYAALSPAAGNAATMEKKSATGSLARNKTWSAETAYAAPFSRFAAPRKGAVAGAGERELGGLQSRQFEILKKAQRTEGASGRGGKMPVAPRAAPLMKHSAPAAPARENDEKKMNDASKSEIVRGVNDAYGAVSIEYAHVHPRAAVTPDLQETVLWAPALTTDRGVAGISFDLSDKVTTYRVLILGHTTDGRLGMVQAKLQSLPGSTGR